MRSGFPKRKVGALGAGLLLLVLLALAWMAVTPQSHFPPEPHPNGYYDFVAAGQMTSDGVEDYQDLDHASLQRLVSAHEEACKRLREGFGRPCAVPLQHAITNFAVWSKDLMSLKRLAKLLSAEGRLAEMDGRPGDAARSYVEILRLGNEISRQGFLIARMVGIAIEGIGAQGLGRVLPALNPGQTRVVIRELENLERSRVSWQEVRRAERLFMRQELKKVSPLSWPQGLWQNWQVLVSTESRHKSAVAKGRLLQAEAAARCYLAEQGRAPPTLQELVPQYLTRVPEDPFTGGSLLYRPQTTNWLLYSVGPDGTDDGGVRAPRGSNKGDLFWN